MPAIESTLAFASTLMLVVFSLCWVLIGALLAWAVLTIPDWETIHQRRASRRFERDIRRRTLRARRELARKLPRAEAKRRQEIKREVIASVLSKGGR